MGFLKRINTRFLKLTAKINPIKYARRLGVKVSGDVRFTGIPDFGTEPWLINIGSKCIITQNVRFMTHDGSINIIRRLAPKYSQLQKFGRIEIGENCFIGAGSTIMPSVHIGCNSIVAACSCVTKDIPPGEVWGGVPRLSEFV